jgi:tetratricopeptide (TPR) repeat protein
MLDEREAAARYRMLETIRDYAREKLDQAGDAAPTAARHCEHFFAMAKAANQGLMGADHAEWIWRVEDELDNLRAAIALALAGGVDRVIAVKIAVALQGFWILRGYTTEGRAVVRAALALPEIQASDRAHAHALYVGAALAASQSDYGEARKMLEACLLLRRRLADTFDIAATLSTLSIVRLPTGDCLGARESELEALALFRGLGETVGEAIGLLHLGQIDAYAGETGRARETLTECLLLSRKIQHQEVEGECELALGELDFETDPAAAKLRFQRSFVVCTESGDKRGEARALRWLGKCDMMDGQIDTAERRLDESLQAFRRLEMREDLLACLDDHSALAVRCGRDELAVQLAAAVDRARELLGLTLPPRRALARRVKLARLRAEMSEERFDAAWAVGKLWDLDAAAKSALTRIASLTVTT